MLFRERFLQGIANGTITLAFRRWTKPSVKAGGTLLTPVGQLSILSVDLVDVARITDAEARRAGFATRDALAAELNKRADGDVFRVHLGELKPDPRIALRSAGPTEAEVGTILAKLEKLDGRSPIGAWTRRTLEVIDKHPAVRAGDICLIVGQELRPFKLNVRKLKALGLTESLEVGYRLSPRGVTVLQAIQARR